MNPIEKYAVDLIHQGGAHCAQGDLNEDDAFDSWDDWREACDLGRDMARIIRERQESFLTWYRAQAQAQAQGAVRWELPAEPGPQVYAVRTDLGSTFIRDHVRGDWVSVPDTDGHAGGWHVQWREIVVFGLTDVTDQFKE